MTIFFISLCVIFSTIIIAIICSTLRINLKELELVNTKIYKFNLEISLNLCNKIKWFKIILNEKKIEKMKNTSRINKILNSKILRKYKDIQKIVFRKKKEILEILKNLQIEKLNLYAKIGTKNPCVTAYLIASISSILAIVFARRTSEAKYKIEPIYIDKNYIYLSINCIIAIKLVHIINIKKKLRGKEVYQKHGKASNRRTYAHSNG